MLRIVASGSAHTKLEFTYNVAVCTAPVTTYIHINTQKIGLLTQLGGLAPLANYKEGFILCTGFHLGLPPPLAIPCHPLNCCWITLDLI